MKKVLNTILVLFLLTLSGCSYQYEGKEVKTIYYESVNYNGGFTKEFVVDLENGTVKYKETDPIELTFSDFEVIYTFDTSKVEEFMNQAGEAGLFELEKEYVNPYIIDGGGWTFTITYEDGEIKESNGVNEFPDEFKEADYAFFYLYGDDLFNSLPNDYKNPPAVNFSIQYVVGNSHYSTGGLVSPIIYTWHDTEVTVENPFELGYQLSETEFKEGIDYLLTLSTSNYTVRFSRMVITEYDLDGSNEKEIDSRRFFDQKEYDIEVNKIYVIKMTYDYGTCEYYLSTKLTD